VLEGLIGVGRVVEPDPVGDDEARVDVAVLDVLVQRLEVALDVALTVLIVNPLFINAPVGNLSISPP
jgi:hypothetical protein